MLYHQFPNLEWLKSQIEKNFADRKGIAGRSLPTQGWPNVILNVNSGMTFREDIRGPVSIFANLAGESQVSVDGKRVKIREDLFFVTNHDQRYTLEVEKKASTLNIHFGEYFTEQVFDALTQNPSSIIDSDTFILPISRINFHNRLNLKSERFNAIAQDILQSDNDDLRMEEKLFELMSLLLQDQTNLLKQSTHIPALKATTREEITRRLLFATDFIYEHPERSFSLDELASVSCLSKFHFLRLFKILFNETPHQFITKVRIGRAKSLLKKSNLEVNEVAKSVGYRDASSFSRAFYNEVGAYPTAFRCR